MGGLQEATADELGEGLSRNEGIGCGRISCADGNGRLQLFKGQRTETVRKPRGLHMTAIRTLVALAVLAATAGNTYAQRSNDSRATTKSLDKSVKPGQPTEPTSAKSDGIVAAAGGMFCFIVYALVVLVFGLAPTWIALARGHPNTVPIFLVNVLLGGFCGVGWIWALVWSFTNPHPQRSTIVIRDRRSRGGDDFDFGD